MYPFPTPRVIHIAVANFRKKVHITDNEYAHLISIQTQKEFAKLFDIFINQHAIPFGMEGNDGTGSEHLDETEEAET